MKENTLNSVMGTLGLHWFSEDLDVSAKVKEEQGMLSLIEEAKREWESAKAYFDNVFDPDLVEHAVYVNQAAEKRYMYLMKQARNQGLKSSYPLSRID